MSNAIYFDGLSAHLYRVNISAVDNAIVLDGDVAHTYDFTQVVLAEPFEHASSVLYFADGARCEVIDHATRAELEGALGYRKSAVVRWQGHMAAVLACLVLLAALIGALGYWGVPAAAERIAAALPQEVDRTLGDSALAALEREHRLQPSRLSDQRIAHLEDLLHQVTPRELGLRPRLLVRDAPDIGRNAFALPNGTILITDQMVRFISEHYDEHESAADAALAGIFAHEIGHVRLRHSTRALTRASLLTALSAALFGDFSAVAASAPTILLSLEYSRGMETEADVFALSRMRELGISTDPLAHIFKLLEIADPDDTPSWLREVGNYVSTHPDGTERSERFSQPDDPAHKEEAEPEPDDE